MMLKNVKMPTVAGGGTNSSSLKSALRRGFTIMELVIVIAVIAVLAAVLIPTFANLTQRANESADTQTVKNLNTILSSEEVLGNKAENMTEAIEIASSGGYNVTALTPTSDGNDILWNQDTNRFVLADSETGELVYADEQVDNPEISVTGCNYTYWKITDSDTNVEDGKYSYYLSDSFVDNDITVTTGIDVGENTDINITYQTTASQSVIFNTNGGTLTIDAAYSDVKHYGTAEATNITAVKGESYELYGTVQTLEIQSGRVYAAAGSVITTLYAAPSGNATVLVDADENADITAVVKGSGNVTISDTVSSSSDVVESSEDTNKFDGGTGMPSSPFIINTADQFMAINELGTTSYYYQLSNDIDLTEQIATNGALIQSLENGTIDGNEHKITIKNDNSEERVALFNNFVESTLKNVTIEMDGKDITIAMGYVNDSHVYDAVFDNVTTTGTVEFTGHNYGLFVAYAGRGNRNLAGQITFIDCVNAANVNSTGSQDAYNAIFVGYSWGAIDLTFIDCSNEGTFRSGKAAIFLGNQSNSGKDANGQTIHNSVTLTIENFKNEGTVWVSYRADNYVPNQYVASVNSEEYIDLTVDGVTKKTTEASWSNFAQIPEDTRLTISMNDDKTFTVTQATTSDVAYYVVSYATYMSWWGESESGEEITLGTSMVYITERIETASFVDGSANTLIKWLDLVTTNYETDATSTTLGEYTVVTIGGEEYYRIEEENLKLCTVEQRDSGSEAEGIKNSSNLINVVAYNSDGEIVAYASCTATR